MLNFLTQKPYVDYFLPKYPIPWVFCCAFNCDHLKLRVGKMLAEIYAVSISVSAETSEFYCWIHGQFFLTENIEPKNPRQVEWLLVNVFIARHQEYDHCFMVWLWWNYMLSSSWKYKVPFSSATYTLSFNFVLNVFFGANFVSHVSFVFSFCS